MRKIEFRIVDGDIEKAGQFTGLSDKNGKEIYEGDIVRWIDRENVAHYYHVYWNDGQAAFCAKSIGEEGDIPLYWMKDVWKMNIEVVGNIHKNPELVKEA